MPSPIVTAAVVGCILLLLIAVFLVQMRERSRDERVRRVNVLAARYRSMRSMLDQLPRSYISKAIRVRLLERLIETCQELGSLQNTQDFRADIDQAQQELEQAKSAPSVGDEHALIQDEQQATAIRSLLKQLYRFIEDEQHKGRLDAKTASQNLTRTAFLIARSLADLYVTRAQTAKTNRKYRVAIECYHSAIEAMEKIEGSPLAQQHILLYRKQIKELDRLATEEMTAQNLKKEPQEVVDEDNGSTLSEQWDQLMSEEDKWKKKQTYD